MIRHMKNKGAGLVEYATLAGLISVVSIGSVIATGEGIESTFSTSASTLATSVADASSGVSAGHAATSSETSAPLPAGAIGASEVPLHFTLTAGEGAPGGTRGFGTSYGSPYGSIVVSDDSTMTPSSVWWNPANLMGGLYLNGDQRLAVNTGGTIFECDGFAPMPISDSRYVNYNGDPDVDKTFIAWDNSGHIYEVGQDYNCALYKP